MELLNEEPDEDETEREDKRRWQDVVKRDWKEVCRVCMAAISSLLPAISLPELTQTIDTHSELRGV